MKLDLFASYLSKEKLMKQGKSTGHLPQHRVPELSPSVRAPSPEADLHLGSLHDGGIPFAVGNISNFTRPKDGATGGGGEPFIHRGTDC